MTHPRLLSVLSFIAAGLLWEGVTQAGWIPDYILPAPSVIIAEMFDMRGLLLRHTYITAIEIILGFLLAVIGGVGLAILMVYVRSLEQIFYPWMVVLQVIPKVAIAPLLLMWFGFDLLPKVVIAFLVAFFPVLVDAMVGFRSVEREPIFLLRSMGADQLRTFWHVQLPTALPNIFGGMKVAITMATVGAIVAEFVGANVGLGYLLMYANGTINTKLLFAALVVISLLALFFYALVSAAEKAFMPWHVSLRNELPRAAS